MKVLLVNVCQFSFSEVNLLNALEVDERIAGVQSIDGRYRAYQFYMFAEEIKAEQEARDELIRDFIRDKEFVFIANVRHDKSTASSLFSMMTQSGKIKFSIWIDANGRKVGIRMHNRNAGKVTSMSEIFASRKFRDFYE